MKLDVYPVGYYMAYSKRSECILAIANIRGVDCSFDKNTTSDNIHYNGLLWRLGFLDYGMEHFNPSWSISQIKTHCNGGDYSTIDLIPISEYTASMLISAARTKAWNVNRKYKNWSKNDKNDKAIFLGKIPDPNPPAYLKYITNY